jgi:diguanylate cyclase (GGDEF)-like protein
MLWLYYCVFRIYQKPDVKRWIRYLLALPAVLYAGVIIATLPGGVAFGIDASNGFVEGVAYILSYIVGLLYIAAAAVFIYLKRKTLSRGELIPYLLIPAIPVMLALIEVATESLIGLMWAGTSLVILEIQMFVLNNKTNVDHLTGLNNRMALDAYIRLSIQDSHNNYKPLGLIMMDVDDFKHINDRYGHIEGDRALKTTADILRECFVGKHFIARYGGDEFAVVLRDCSREMMVEYLEKLEEERVRHNKAAGRQYEIKLSIGASVFRETEITDIHTMLMQVDNLMYKEKNIRKETAAAQ